MQYHVMGRLPRTVAAPVDAQRFATYDEAVLHVHRLGRSYLDTHPDSKATLYAEDMRSQLGLRVLWVEWRYGDVAHAPGLPWDFGNVAAPPPLVEYMQVQ